MPNDVTVRQVLAGRIAAYRRTWATLPTARRWSPPNARAKVCWCFHVTADTLVDLPLSGAFVDISGASSRSRLRCQCRQHCHRRQRCRQPSGPGRAGDPRARRLRRVLDAAGNRAADPVNFSERASADHPPGFYVPPEGLVAVNTLAPSDRPQPLDVSPLNARLDVYRHGEPLDLRGPIFLSALALLLLDALVVFWLSGGLGSLRLRRRVAASLLAAGLLTALTLNHPAQAQTPAPQQAPKLSASQEDFALKATQQPHLAYIVTGDAEIDAISKAGLQGLTLFLAQRTALEAGEPIGLDPARDELAFFPLIYWPVSTSAPKPSQTALEHIDSYMKRGGTILFDTRDAIDAPPRPGGEMQGPGMVALRTILSSLDIPELEPVPRDHVLTKTFFLLRDFPGRFTNGQLWVEALPAESEEEQSNRPARAGDGVTSILITSNDLAGAWAMRPDGQPMLPLVPGEPRQREYAFRAGVNIVMYALTGNYKADQVHIPALLERLGQ